MVDELLVSINEQESLKSDKAFCEQLAASLHTYYIKGFNYENEILKLIGKSKLSDSIILMPKQIEMLNFIMSNKNVVLSAPTSFGKSFIILEYIKRLKKENVKLIVYIVHTKALCTEVRNNMNKYFGDNFNIVDDFDSVIDSNLNIVVMISDGQNIYEHFDTIKNIDLLIIDEAYNLGKDTSGSRFLTIFNTCHEMMKRSKKIILAGPYIKNVIDKTDDGFGFKLFLSNYSPVTEKLKEGMQLFGLTPKDKFIECILNKETSIGFINSKDKIYNQLNELCEGNQLPIIYNDSFIEWMKGYFPDFWILPKLMERGISVYHSSFPKYLNLYGMDLFNKRIFKGLFTTSAILEGVNTSAKNVIIYETSSGSNNQITLTPFQFFNLCGRAGRLGQEIVGNIYNFGNLYGDRYNEKSLDLVIGADPETKEMKFNLGIKDQETESIEKQIIKELKDIGIDYIDWYDKNKFFFGHNCEKLLRLIKIYNNFKTEFRTEINSGNLYKNGSNELNKPKTLEYIYKHFIKNAGCHFTQEYELSVPKLINDLVSSKYDGISFSFKEFCKESFYFSKLLSDQTSVSDKNKKMVIAMKIAYDYIQYEYNYANTLLRDFIAHDSFFDDDDRKKLNEAYFNRIRNYLKTSEDNRVSKYLIDLGVIPPLISKLIQEMKKKEIDSTNMTNKDIYETIKAIVTEKQKTFSNYEVINLQNIKLL